ncbi:26295_t:CDS:1, partial [Gigaspora rosea]
QTLLQEATSGVRAKTHSGRTIILLWPWKKFLAKRTAGSERGINSLLIVEKALSIAIPF